MKIKPVHSLQDTFLNALIYQQPPVFVYLKTHIRLKGFIIKHTGKAVFLKQGLDIQMIYKNAISAIMPESVLKQYEK